MKKNPIKGVQWMTYLLAVAVLIVPIISTIAKEKTPEWILAVLFLFCSMCIVSAAIQHMAKRIEELEAKLKSNQPEKEC